MPQPPRFDWKEMVEMMAKEGQKSMHIMLAEGGWESQQGAPMVVASVTMLAASIVAIALFWFTRRPVRPALRRKYKISGVRFNEDEKDDKICKDQHIHILGRDDVRVSAGGNMVHNQEEEEENIMDDYDSSCDSSPYRLSAISDISHIEEHSDDWDDDGDDCDGRVTPWALRNKFISTSMRE
mmetsp:Transcript_36232/g.76383  ORF Transcript_36232/g.76383 Transcript_36232/m.76383 type:complete len:182 (+) Transcript_36232:260-805(+)